jgi:hypothetical protein
MNPSGAAVKQLPDKLNPARCRAFQHDVEKSVSEMLRPAIVFQVPPSVKLDSYCLNFLIRCARVAAEHDAEVAIAASNAEHQVLLEVTRLSLVLPTFLSAEDAAAYLNKYRAPTFDAERFELAENHSEQKDLRTSSGKSTSLRERNRQP